MYFFFYDSFLFFLRQYKVAVKVIRSHCKPESEKGDFEKVSNEVSYEVGEGQAKAETLCRK